MCLITCQRLWFVSPLLIKLDNNDKMGLMCFGLLSHTFASVCMNSGVKQIVIISLFFSFLIDSLQQQIEAILQRSSCFPRAYTML